jgi:NitT/TauT family transport system permease protein
VTLLFSALGIALFFGLWWFLTRGDNEQRIISPLALPSPSETFAEFHSLWFDRALTRNMIVTLKRVTLGFALAFAIGVPLGVLAGCFSAIRAFLAPVVVFGRNIPLAALIPLTFFFFGIGEWQKIMFIFIACVAFIIADVTLAISDVSTRYLDTAYTLGANSWQAIMKVLVPLAMPTVFDSARVLFGLAFGYIMLAEMVKLGDEEGGLGYLIRISQRQGPREHIYLIILLIPVVALIIDRIFFWVQRELFPHRYGGAGIFNHMLRGVIHVWDDLKCKVFSPRPPFNKLTEQQTAQSNSRDTDST